MIIANMVVRNEAGAYLPQVLERLQNQVDLITITDDCSDDNTVEVARSFEKVSCQVLDKPMFRENEGMLRQASWKWMENNIYHQNWDPNDVLVLAIDADEELYETGPKLEELATWQQFGVFDVTFFHMWNETHFRVDGGWRPHGSFRCFRYEPHGVFRDRKLACGSEPTYVFEKLHTPQYCRNTGLVMKHLSYIKDEDKKIKHDRYVELDGGAFHAGAHIKSIMDPPEKVALGPWTFG